MKRIILFLVPLVICLLGLKIVAKADELPGIRYQSHVQNVGWQGYVSNGSDSGTTGRSLRMEALKIEVTNATSDMKLKYQAHVQNVGWQDWVEGGQIAGTSGRSLRVEAIKIQLENASGYSIQYQVHVEGIGWTNWVKDGQLAGTTGRSLRVEAIRIKLVKNNDTNSNNNTNTNGNATLKYSTHIQNVGWQQQKNEGEIAGLPGQGLRIASLNIIGSNFPSGMQITYQTHVQNVGWTSWVNGGVNSGNETSSLRIEGIRVKLTGNTGDYHIIYKTYVEGRGWQGWLKDGQSSGYVGRNLRVEAIQVKLVKTSELANYVKPKVAIDIGHNTQWDSGAKGIKQEDELTKEVGDKVINKLKDLGYSVIDTLPSSATSTEDSLTQRSDFANKNEVERFVCIHFNVFDGSADGSEVYYQTNSEVSKSLATAILNNLTSLGFTNRGVKTNNFAVLRNTIAPAVLIESCFIDNTSDMSKYDSEKLANAIVNGLVSNVK
ncbi:N-acetylmuramoyl-L-alanine amidase [Clostridium sp. YIM B02505]|uniref:N-acetylmuramoyl-L-alanine amidase n=1 Tax=Clostridium yunnanense TaxID=2800325 RepID=A0ABS1EWZ1_9CLOT|nr:N-acetylmuramoyl-L-alanine amidase [Clostridium yunnanense]MBK1813897.1 N-acetylmuramoyl-L-alanine amidase [Clostridium yunnanense]